MEEKYQWFSGLVLISHQNIRCINVNDTLTEEHTVRGIGKNLRNLRKKNKNAVSLFN